MKWICLVFFVLLINVISAETFNNCSSEKASQEYQSSNLIDKNETVVVETIQTNVKSDRSMNLRVEQFSAELKSLASNYSSGCPSEYKSTIVMMLSLENTKRNSFRIVFKTKSLHSEKKMTKMLIIDMNKGKFDGLRIISVENDKLKVISFELFALKIKTQNFDLENSFISQNDNNLQKAEAIGYWCIKGTVTSKLSLNKATFQTEKCNSNNSFEVLNSKMDDDTDECSEQEAKATTLREKIDEMKRVIAYGLFVMFVAFAFKRDYIMFVNMIC
jgi:hypothetical protein